VDVSTLSELLYIFTYTSHDNAIIRTSENRKRMYSAYGCIYLLKPYSVHITVTPYETDLFQLFMCSISRWISIVYTCHIIYCVRIWSYIGNTTHVQENRKCIQNDNSRRVHICYYYCHSDLLLLFLHLVTTVASINWGVYYQN